jgi:hypothetical protein
MKGKTMSIQDYIEAANEGDLKAKRLVLALHFVRMSFPNPWHSTPLRDVIKTWDELYALGLRTDPTKCAYVAAWRPIPKAKPMNYKLPRVKDEEPTPARYTLEDLEAALRPFGFKVP